MARPTDLTDPFVQTALVEAEQALDTGDYLRTVRKCVEVYSRASIMAPATHLLFLDDAKAPNCQKNNGFKGLGNYSEWPKVAGALIQAYSRIAEQRPDIILKPPSQLMPLPRARSVREGRRNALLPWPVRLGVGISFDENDKPHLTFEKEEFSMSEAAAYFEYTLDVAMRAQRG